MIKILSIFLFFLISVGEGLDPPLQYIYVNQAFIETGLRPPQTCFLIHSSLLLDT